MHSLKRRRRAKKGILSRGSFICHNGAFQEIEENVKLEWTCHTPQCNFTFWIIRIHSRWIILPIPHCLLTPPWALFRSTRTSCRTFDFPVHPSALKIWITYIQAYMPYESSEVLSNQPDGRKGSHRCPFDPLGPCRPTPWPPGTL